MRRVIRFFTIFSIDFWLFIVLIVVLTALIRYSNNNIQVTGAPLQNTGVTVPYSETAGKREQNLYLYAFSIAAVGCVFLMQENRRNNLSPLSWFSVKAGERFTSIYSSVELNNYQSGVLTMAALLFVFFSYMVGELIIGSPIIVFASLLLVIAVIFAFLCICLLKGMSENMRYLFIVICLALPVAVALLTGNSGAVYMPGTYAWTIAAVTFSMLLINRKAPKIFFKLFACMLFVGIFCQVRFTPNIDFIKTVKFISNIFYTGFVIFAPLDFRMERSLENFRILEVINKELHDTQTQLVQRERMVTLGQLIAGVAHEINTPIGAIKASAEMFDSMDMGKLLKDVKRYDDDALEALITVLNLCTRSIKNMRSTRDIRRGKTQIRQFMESIEIEKSDEICSLLSGMEICDIEKIETNMDLFRRVDITEILKSAHTLKPYISSLQSISFASNGVSKIIFALKSFSHMNTTGERRQFDIVKNIDNELVLYHNQIKRGIEINKIYDEYVPPIYGNVEELNQVWTNIIHNAIYAMSYVGELTIAIKSLDNKKVSISFTDTGTGIPQDHIDKLFDPFFSTKPLGEGSGLGLDICKKVIEKHDGDIKVISKPGQGAKFTITLPAAEQ